MAHSSTITIYFWMKLKPIISCFCISIFVLNFAADSTAAEATKPCFLCHGTGGVKCTACTDGHMPCPGSCMKKSDPGWAPLPGHDGLWLKFNNRTGGDGYQAWSQGHIGQVVEYQNGIAVNVGVCKICQGKTYVDCTSCKGTKLVACNMCEGKKVVPISWTLTNNPKMSKPDDEAVIDIRGDKIIKGPK